MAGGSFIFASKASLGLDVRLCLYKPRKRTALFPAECLFHRLRLQKGMGVMLNPL